MLLKRSQLLVVDFTTNMCCKFHQILRKIEAETNFLKSGLAENRYESFFCIKNELIVPMFGPDRHSDIPLRPLAEKILSRPEPKWV